MRAIQRNTKTQYFEENELLDENLLNHNNGDDNNKDDVRTSSINSDQNCNNNGDDRSYSIKKDRTEEKFKRL